MANLVLGAAGAALGGPVGASIGATIGRELNRSFSARAAARINDVRIPSSRYGDAIPEVHGRMRVAGLVLWSAPPVPTAVVSKTGSGQALSVSFAFAVSSRPISTVHRIWADGKLIRDADGRQSVFFTLRVHKGDEDQPADPLIASASGTSSCPAYRGIAYLLFENFDLSSFGSRLPIITVEIEADASAASSAEDLARSCLGMVDAEDGGVHPIVGAGLSSDDGASAAAPLIDAFATRFAFDAGGWTSRPAGRLHSIPTDLWQLDRPHRSAGEITGRALPPTRVSLRYFEPDLDFAASEKSARTPGDEQLRRIELPIAMSGSAAKAAAFEILARQADGRDVSISLPLAYAPIQLGDRLCRDGDDPTTFVVSEKHLSARGLQLRLRPAPDRLPDTPADIGGRMGQQTIDVAPMRVTLVELPGDGEVATPRAAVLTSGGLTPFEPVTVHLSGIGMEQSIASAVMPAVGGHLLAPLPVAPSDLIDRVSRLRVEVAEGATLVSCDEPALLGGANLAWVGGEFLQFATAMQTGARTYELRDLLRGRFGSDVATPHAAGSDMLLLDPGAMRVVALDTHRIGSEIRAEVHGLAGDVATSTLLVQGLAAKPWRPAHLTATLSPLGLTLDWVRRGPAGAAWLDHVETPQPYRTEAYEVRVRGADGVVVTLPTSTPRGFLDADTLGTLGARPWQVEVRQIGDTAVSEAAVTTIF